MERTTIIQKRVRLRVFPALAVFSCLAGCGGASVKPDAIPADTFPQQLTSARTRWTQKGLRSYRFTVQMSCFCLEENVRPVTITVREGVTDASTHFRSFGTIEKVFETLEAAYNSKANTLDARFTADGWPSVSSVDPRADTYDDEYSLTITEVKAL